MHCLFTIVIQVGFTNNMNGWYPEEHYLPENQKPYIDCGLRNNSLPWCLKRDKYCLFDLRDDPCEYNNIASLYPQICETMYARLIEFAGQAQPPRIKPSDPSSFPKNHDGHWTNWVDEHPIWMWSDPTCSLGFSNISPAEGIQDTQTSL